jgi:hypothetical protein
MSDKPRPVNAAGTNGLRGGIKMYSAKVVTGPWLDTLGGTAGYKRGFTTVDYQTEAQHQQLGVTLIPSPLFGAELPDDVQINRPLSPFKNISRGNEKWCTSTKEMSTALVNQPKVSIHTRILSLPFVDVNCCIC